MAKKSKAPRLTEADKERLEQCFQRVRDERLRQWYEKAQSEDPNLNTFARSRLQLQLMLRDQRKEVDRRKQERDACKAEGDDEGAASARKKMKKASIAMSSLANGATEGRTPSSIAKACRKWMAKTHTLEEILGDSQFDKRTEFGVNQDSLLGFIAHESEHLNDALENYNEEFEGAMEGLALEDFDMGTLSERSEPNAAGTPSDSLASRLPRESEADMPVPSSSSIWVQHTLRMQARYRATGLPDFAIETRLAYQKKLFDKHVHREQLLAIAAEETLGLGGNAEYPMREGVGKTYNAVLATSTFSEDSLWELTSPMLWHCSVDGFWPTDLQWCPTGTMRVQTVSNISKLYLDLGVSSFTAERLSIPPNIGQQALVFSAHDMQGILCISIEIFFLAGGFAKVRLPTLAFTQSHTDQRTPSMTHVELTGFWMGRLG